EAPAIKQDAASRLAVKGKGNAANNVRLDLLVNPAINPVLAASNVRKDKAIVLTIRMRARPAIVRAIRTEIVRLGRRVHLVAGDPSGHNRANPAIADLRIRPHRLAIVRSSNSHQRLDQRRVLLQRLQPRLLTAARISVRTSRRVPPVSRTKVGPMTLIRAR